MRLLYELAVTSQFQHVPRWYERGPPAQRRSSRRAGRGGRAAAASRRGWRPPAAPAAPARTACGSSPPGNGTLIVNTYWNENET